MVIDRYLTVDCKLKTGERRGYLSTSTMANVDFRGGRSTIINHVNAKKEEANRNFLVSTAAIQVNEKFEFPTPSVLRKRKCGSTYSRHF